MTRLAAIVLLLVPFIPGVRDTPPFLSAASFGGTGIAQQGSRTGRRPAEATQAGGPGP